MSEELAKELQLEEEAAAFPEVVYVTLSTCSNKALDIGFWLRTALTDE